MRKKQILFETFMDPFYVVLLHIITAILFTYLSGLPYKNSENLKKNYRLEIYLMRKNDKHYNHINLVASNYNVEFALASLVY